MDVVREQEVPVEPAAEGLQALPPVGATQIRQAAHKPHAIAQDVVIGAGEHAAAALAQSSQPQRKDGSVVEQSIRRLQI